MNLKIEANLKLAILAFALSPMLSAQTPTTAPVDAAKVAQMPAPVVVPVVATAACVAQTTSLAADYLTDAARLLAGYDTSRTGEVRVTCRSETFPSPCARPLPCESVCCGDRSIRRLDSDNRSQARHDWSRCRAISVRDSTKTA